jgi:hypothetical protein
LHDDCVFGLLVSVVPPAIFRLPSEWLSAALALDATLKSATKRLHLRESAPYAVLL